MGTDRDSYCYQTWDRLELPIDLSKKGLASKLGCSSHQIDSALKALDGKNADVLNSCYSKLVRGRNAGVMPDKRNSNVLDTTTFAFYWEIIELLKALTTAKQRNKRAKKDELAAYTFEMLADDLSKKLTESVPLNFSQRKILNDQNIQNKLNMDFLGEVHKRLEAVKYIVEHDPTSEQILAVCDKLDSLIMEWIYDKNFDYYEAKKITVQSVEALYDSLMRVRTDRYTADTSGNSIIPYDAASRIPPTIRFEASSDIIEDLQEFLPQKTTRIKDEQKLTELAHIYEQFLTFNIDEQEKESVSASIKSYLTLKDYVAPKENQGKAIEDDIRRDLTKFVKEQFSELQKLEYVPFPHSTYESHSLQTDFLKERIKNVQAKIMYEFYEPFRLLRIFYSIRNFTCFDAVSIEIMKGTFKVSPSFQDLVAQMKWTIYQLGMENTQLPLAKFRLKLPVGEFFLEYFKQIPKEQFLREYRNTVVPIFSKEPEILESVLASLTTGTYMTNALFEASAISSLLFWSCQIAMLNSIAKWTDLLSEDYINLRKFYCRFEQNQKGEIGKYPPKTD